MDNKENFKHLLEYFVAHLEYVNGSSNPQGKNMYIDPLLQNDFKRTGCGYDNDAIQEQISSWDKYDGRRIGITIQANFGSYISKKCYLNWVGTGINIFAEWKENKVNSLYIGHCYWWLENQAERYSDKLLEKKTTELGLFNNDSVSTDLNAFYDCFKNEIIDYDNKKGVYYMREKEDNKEDDSEEEGSSGEMIQYKKFLNSNYNLILTGAPGTGKTYLAKQIAQQLIFGEVKKEMTDEEKKQFNEQCGFVQFHPSYDYTDFVEGIRPNDNNGFERRDGVFIKFCNKALMNIENSKKKPDVLSMENSVKKKYEYLLSKIDAGEIQEVTLRTNKKMLVDKISNNKNIILKANQTTTTTHTVSLNRILKLSEKFHDKNSLDNISNINTEITDVIGGCNASAYWAVLHLVYEQELEILSNSTSETKKYYVFIIDEINRGEISKIFGELFYSIDPGYRGKDGKVKTQYASMQHEPNDFDVALGIKDRDECGWFYVPENVYIIGTMNDIDRSVESMDFAFRRRFAFKEIKAKDRIEMLYDTENGIREYAERAKNRMSHLNEEIEKTEGLSSAYHVGPAYFLKLKNYNGDFNQLWEYHLDGLLREYLRGMQNVDDSMGKLKTAYENENPTDGQ